MPDYRNQNNMFYGNRGMNYRPAGNPGGQPCGNRSPREEMCNRPCAPQPREEMCNRPCAPQPREEVKCPCEKVVIEKTEKRCREEIDCYSIGMAYVPWQQFRNLWEPDQALVNGTIFKELTLPYVGRRCR